MEENMNIEELIARINYLYKKSQEEGLNEKEKEEQKLLRREYVERVKLNFRAQLNQIERKTPDKGLN
ncbi:hypothetical protein HMPREF1982_04055 [Clostridiales bacterium oral taxon 876 str. F0540]|nr:hypothetical protein HMPREF1982_04055 [Clostridiales bacterium oral taxon 876 str. F0540]